jgi:hypothetical protein
MVNLGEERKGEGVVYIGCDKSMPYQERKVDKAIWT